MTDMDPLDVEEVLLEFAAEPLRDRATLERYLREHPSIAEALIDMSLELRLQRVAADATVPTDEAWVDASWRSFQEAMSAGAAPNPVADPFTAMSPAALVTLRRNLRIPSGVVQGFRTRVVDAGTVPERFLAALARELGASLDGLRAFLANPPRLVPGMSYKSDAPPSVHDRKISFEQLLLDAKVSEGDRARLLADEG